MKDHFAMFRFVESLTAAARMQRETVDTFGAASKIVRAGVVDAAPKLGRADAADLVSKMAGISALDAAPKLGRAGAADFVSKMAGISALDAAPKLGRAGAADLVSKMAGISALDAAPKLGRAGAADLVSKMAGISALDAAPKLGNIGAFSAALKMPAAHNVATVFGGPTSHGSFSHAFRTPNVDVHSLLDPASSNKEFARGVEQLVGALESIAVHATFARGHDNAQERKSDRDRGTESEEGYDARQPPARDRLWVPRPYPVVWTPGGLQHQQRAPQERLEPVQVFCGSARRDEDHKLALLKHLSALRRNGIVRTWHEGDLLAGDDRNAAIWHNLELAQLILLLISADYLSDHAEMLDRLEGRCDRVVVVPILVRPVDIEGTFIERLSPLPSTGQAVTKWGNPDEAWTDVAQGVRRVVESIRSASVQLY